MSKNANFVSHKKSKQIIDGKPKLPLASDLVEGEIAINFGKDVETLSIKNESGDVVTFSSDNYYTEKKLGSGFTGENSDVTVTDVILWVSGTGESSAVLKGSSGTASGDYSVAEGRGTKANGGSSHAEGYSTAANGQSSHAEGYNTSAMTNYSHAEGYSTTASGQYSHAEGSSTTASGESSHAEGYNTVAKNKSEHASGQYNVSSSASTTFGDSGNTLFSVGNGTANDASHNAFEIRQNGDIYIVNKDGDDVRLQDEIGNIAVDQDFSNTASTNPISTKAVYSALTDNELVWTNAFVALSGITSAHTENTEIHVTAADKEKLHTHSNKAALDNITGDVGTMAYEDKTSYSSATEVNTALGNKANTASTLAGYGIADAYTKSETSGATEISNALDTKADSSDLTSLSGTVTAHTANTDIHVTTANKTAWDAKAELSDIPSVTEYADSVKYNSTSKEVEFYHGGTGGTKVFSYDASPFLIDGMVQNVEIKNVTSGESQVTCLVVSFNTDAGKQDINIPLTEIFDASNYYTTAQTSGATELQTAFNGKTDTATTTALNNAVTAHTANTNIHLTTTEKSQLHTHTNKTALDSITGNVGTMAYENVGSYSSATQVSTALSNKVDTTAFTNHTGSSVHMTATEKTNLDSLATNIAAISGITSTKVSNWDGAANNSHTHSNKTYLDGITRTVGTMAYQATSSYSSATQVNTALNSKVDKTEYATFSAATNTSIEDLSGQSETVAAALVDLNTAITPLAAHTADTSIHITQALLDRIAVLENKVRYNGHDYIEIGGLKWATMNIGATGITDTGLYFQWGDTQGYTAEQVGSGEGQKYFGWADYKYGNGTSSPSATDMTKYNETDGKTVLESADDAAVANWGGGWRMPTAEEYVALGNSVNTAWTTNYLETGVAGLICTDKTASYNVLFFPAAGICGDGIVELVGGYGRYWSSSLATFNRQYGRRLEVTNLGSSWASGSFGYRYYGYSVRPVVG